MNEILRALADKYPVLALCGTLFFAGTASFGGAFIGNSQFVTKTEMVDYIRDNSPYKFREEVLDTQISGNSARINEIEKDIKKLSLSSNRIEIYLELLLKDKGISIPKVK